MSIENSEIASTVLIFDFDGTVSQGHGPVLEYARAISFLTGIAGISLDANRALTTTPVSVDNDALPRDGYDAVQRIADRYGVSSEICDQAYQQSRLSLAASGIHPVPGLANYLRDCPHTTILATNSPSTGFAAALKVLGLSDCFDRVINSLGKPNGLARLLHDEYPSAHVIGIGDIWEFDLAPIAARGGETILIQSQFTQAPDCKPTWEITNPAELVPLLTRITAHNH